VPPQPPPPPPPEDADALRRGRDAFDRRDWAAAHEALTRADRYRPLAPDDVERLATAAYLLGQDEESAGLRARAYRGHCDDGLPQRAARCAFWLVFVLANAGDMAQATGWLARAQRLLDTSAEDCVEHGYLRVPAALERLQAADWESAHEAPVLRDPRTAREGRGRVAGALRLAAPLHPGPLRRAARPPVPG
jgi:hypothetical protein